MADKQADAVVLGGGPGGYVAAIRLAQLGKKTVLVEEKKLGGVCLNVGCIPSKALIHAGKLFQEIRRAGDIGILVPGEPTLDLRKLVAWKKGVVDRLVGGIAHLMKGNKVEVVAGRGRLEDSRTVTVEGGGEPVRVRAAAGVILATGSRTVELPGLPFDGQRVFNSDQVLELAAPPKHLVVIGGGIIGLELGQFFLKVGSKLTVVELLDQLLPGTDPELVNVIERELKKAKAAIHTKSKASGLQATQDGVRLAVETPAGAVAVEADAVLVTVGRRPNSDGLGLERVGVAVGKGGFVQVNQRMETSVPGVFAIGDLAGPPLLAHKASKEGQVAAEALAGRKTVYDVRAMPSAIFTDPEIATVGLNTEAAAREAGFDPLVAKFPFAASGRALSTGEAVGFAKVVADRKSKVLLGAGIVGPEASNLIAEAALAIELGGTVEDIGLTVHAHPTLPESFAEACELALGHPIHVLAT